MSSGMGQVTQFRPVSCVVLRHWQDQLCFALCLPQKSVDTRLGGAATIWEPHELSKQTQFRESRAKEDPSGIMWACTRAVPRDRYMYLDFSVTWAKIVFLFFFLFLRPAFFSSFNQEWEKYTLNYHTIVFILYASKVMLQVLQARLNSMWTESFQMFKLDLGKAEESEIKLPTSIGS